MHILLVEPNKRRSLHLRQVFTRLFYQVDIFESAEAALTRLERRPLDYDLALVNIYQRDLEAPKWCEAIRNSQNDIFIIAIGKQVDDLMVTNMLLNYVDDFIRLPVRSIELVARIHAVMRRPRQTNGRQRRFPAFIFDHDQKSIEYKGHSIQFSRREFLILEHLIDRQGQVVTKEDIMGRCWDVPEAVSLNTINAHIKNIRKKLALIATSQILTVRGIGYKLIIDRPKAEQIASPARK